MKSLLADPSGASIKRIAWAYGCAKKDSDEERTLYHALLEKVAEIERGRVVASLKREHDGARRRAGRPFTRTAESKKATHVRVSIDTYANLNLIADEHGLTLKAAVELVCTDVPAPSAECADDCADCIAEKARI